MIIGKTVLIATVLAFAPFAASAVNAQDQRNTMAAEHQDRATARDRHDQRDMGNRDNRDMRDRDRRDMHRGWSNGHHYGWHRHCMMSWRHHHRVRVCR